MVLSTKDKETVDAQVRYINAEWRDKDPIRRFGEDLKKQQMISQDEIADMQASAQTTIDEAVQFMTESPWPSPDSMTDHVYA